MINEIITEAVDEESGFVLKTIKTDYGEFTNRIIAFSNFMFHCEQDRLLYDRPIFKCPMQTCHIGQNPYSLDWNYGDLLAAKKHARDNQRIFLVHKQRSEKQLSGMKLKDSEKDFHELKNFVDNIPVQLPPSATLEDWENLKAKLTPHLKEGQILFPVLSSKHNVASFPLIIKKEIGNSKIIGINSYEMSSASEITNLSYLRAINSSIKPKQKTSLFVNFGLPRILTRLGNVSGSFGFSCFGGDVFSERAFLPTFPQMARDRISFILKRKPTEFPYYDPNEKKFNKSLPQRDWYGADLTGMTMDGISVSEGLDGYQVIKCISHFLQQKELDYLNNLLRVKQSLSEYMRNYTGWNVFLSKVMQPVSNSNRRLSEF